MYCISISIVDLEEGCFACRFISFLGFGLLFSSAVLIWKQVVIFLANKTIQQSLKIWIETFHHILWKWPKNDPLRRMNPTFCFILLPWCVKFSLVFDKKTKVTYWPIMFFLCLKKHSLPLHSCQFFLIHRDLFEARKLLHYCQTST